MVVRAHKRPPGEPWFAPTNSQRKAYGPLPQAVQLTFASRSSDLPLAARRPAVVIAPPGVLLVAPAGIWPW